MSSLFCKHRNKQINVNSIDTCSHITHLQTATLQSTFSIIAFLWKYNYAEQLRRVLNQICLTWTLLLHGKTMLNKPTLHVSACSYKHVLVSSLRKVIHRKLTHTDSESTSSYVHKKGLCIMSLCSETRKLQNSNYTTFWKTMK